MRRFFAVLMLMPFAGGVLLRAQKAPSLGVGVTYVAERSLKAGIGQNFWMQDGSIELGANVFKGFGVAASVIGAQPNSIGSSGIPISLVTATFGPRYRWRADRKIFAYGEVLAGEANGFNSLFPTPFGAQSQANGLPCRSAEESITRWGPLRHSRTGCRLGPTQLPNSTDNVQNNLRLGAGLVARFGRSIPMED